MSTPIADVVIDLLNDKAGFNGWWCEVDAGTQEEIKKEIQQRVEAKLNEKAVFRALLIRARVMW
jgi:hypothetical protein